MKVTRVSKLTGDEHTRDIDVNPDDLEAYENGSQAIQRAFPHLDADDREFLMTGITPDEWDRFVGSEE